MSTARQIMKKKSFIKAEMDRTMSKNQSDRLWLKSTKRLEKILTHYKNLSKGVHIHTDNYIFPAAAITAAGIANPSFMTVLLTAILQPIALYISFSSFERAI